MKSRVYVCHTYYHVYVSFLKEMNRAEQDGGATLILSLMTQNMSRIKPLIEDTGVFQEVILFDEKRDSFFPELAPYMNMQGNQLKIMLGRMKYTKLYGKLEEAYIPVDFREYEDIYVYCDSDPIGFYLNYKKIPYHALEDGLDTLKEFPAVWRRNHRFYRLKLFLSSINLLFIEDGFGKYCIDMEVNELEGIQYRNKKYFEVPRQKLVDGLTREQKDILLKAFIADIDQLKELVSHGDAVLVLTEPLCDLETRKLIFQDIVEKFSKEGEIVFKPHPSDVMDYKALYPDNVVLDGKMPMEMMNFIQGLRFKKVVSVFTELGGITFADEKVRLGSDFMDKYEDPSVHRYV